jgi:TusA-related sulfurtransferase
MVRVDERVHARRQRGEDAGRLIGVNSELDLRGEVCPATLVKTILALETMAPGEVLQVSVDHRLAAKDVPLSVSARGHEVLEVRQINAADWTITVRKGTDT